MKIFTIGHGTRSVDEFAAVLHAAAIELLVDVRRFPGSRRYPHFTREQMEVWLPERGVAYDWRGEALGGRRSAPKDRVTRHPAWKVDGFRSYADHMDTDEFRTELARLERDAASRHVAIMCAETLWWKCHRRLIADALAVHGHDVQHLIGPHEAQSHKVHPNLRVEDGMPVYDVGIDRELSL